jgi:hypothetical protein
MSGNSTIGNRVGVVTVGSALAFLLSAPGPALAQRFSATLTAAQPPVVGDGTTEVTLRLEIRANKKLSKLKLRATKGAVSSVGPLSPEGIAEVRYKPPKVSGITAVSFNLQVRVGRKRMRRKISLEVHPPGSGAPSGPPFVIRPESDPLVGDGRTPVEIAVEVNQPQDTKDIEVDSPSGTIQSVGRLRKIMRGDAILSVMRVQYIPPPVSGTLTTTFTVRGTIRGQEVSETATLTIVAPGGGAAQTPDSSVAVTQQPDPAPTAQAPAGDGPFNLTVAKPPLIGDGQTVAELQLDFPGSSQTEGI